MEMDQVYEAGEEGGSELGEKPARPDKDTLWVKDSEMIRRLGVPEKIARQAIRMLDNNPRSGFPKKQSIWGHRRYWPAVKAYFEAANGLKLGVSEQRRAS